MGVSSQGCILFSVQKDCWLRVIKPAEMYAYQILTNSWLVDSAPVTLNVWTIKTWHRSIKETTMWQWRNAFRWSCGRFPVWPQLSFPTVAVTHQKFIDIIWIIVFKDRLCQCFSAWSSCLLANLGCQSYMSTYLPAILPGVQEPLLDQCWDHYSRKIKKVCCNTRYIFCAYILSVSNMASNTLSHNDKLPV